MDTTQIKKKRFDYQPPTQLLTNHPKIKHFYSCTDLGYLLMLKVVTGKKLKRGCLISEADLLNYMRWRFNFVDS